MPDPSSYASVEPQAWTEAVLRATEGESDERKRIVLATMTDVLHQHMAHRLLVRCGEGDTAAIVLCGEDGCATLLALGPATEPLAADAITLGHCVHLELGMQGVRFSQAMRDVERPQQLLESLGYRHLADLDYLVAGCRPRAAQESMRKLSNLPQLRFLSYAKYLQQLGLNAIAEEGELTPLRDLVDRTYIDSEDCPRIAEYRTTDEVLRSYRKSPQHNADLWLVAVDHHDQAVGCLLLTPHGAGGTLEITYMGIVPDCRGRGWGRTFIDEAWNRAERCGASQITLAVDHDNALANRLYQRVGFQPILAESVWGRRLSPSGIA